MVCTMQGLHEHDRMIGHAMHACLFVCTCACATVRMCVFHLAISGDAYAGEDLALTF